jgi:hypothetical protein
VTIHKRKLRIAGWALVVVAVLTQVALVAYLWWDFDTRFSCDRVPSWSEWLACMRGPVHLHIRTLEVAAVTWLLAGVAWLLGRFLPPYISIVVPGIVAAGVVSELVDRWQTNITPFVPFGEASFDDALAFATSSGPLLPFLAGPAAGAWLLGVHARVHRRASAAPAAIDQEPAMSRRRIIQLNLLFVLSLGIYGFMIDEPYWRAVGHAPGLYDYLFWCGLAVNGPSGVAADALSWLIFEDVDSPIHRLPFIVQQSYEWRFAGQYGMWLWLLWLQWTCYDPLATWCVGHRRREIALHVAAVAIVAAGSVLAYQAWIHGHRPMGDAFVDPYFWFVRVVGVALSGLVILAYYRLVKRRRGQDGIASA